MKEFSGNFEKELNGNVEDELNNPDKKQKDVFDLYKYFASETSEFINDDGLVVVDEPVFETEETHYYDFLNEEDIVEPEDIVESEYIVEPEDSIKPEDSVEPEDFSFDQYINGRALLREPRESFVPFEYIVASVSKEDLMKDYDGLSNAQLSEKMENPLDKETQQFYLAYYARMLSEHVGFSSFSEENQTAFKLKVEEIYNSIVDGVKGKDFIENMAKSLALYIEDKHCGVEAWEKGQNLKLPEEKGNVGGNLFHKSQEERPDGYQVLARGERKFDEKGNPDFSTYNWEIGTINKNGEDILVVSIPDLPLTNEYASSNKEFCEAFDKQYLGNKEKWEKGRIILDVRGNGGGEDKPIDHVAKRLYGNHTNSYKRCKIKDTELSNWILHKHGAYKEQNYSRQGIKKEDLVKRQNFSGEDKTMFDETSTYYAFNSDKGYNGKIDILIDRRVGSSAESAYTSFYHHPNTRYIGENTSGMQCYTQGTFTAPWGGSIRIGATQLTYWDKESENIEVKGHKPDVVCKQVEPNSLQRENALSMALSLPVDEGRILGFREKNEEISGNIVFDKEYDPKSPTDPRKAYYAKYLDPALKEIEVANSLSRVREKLQTSPARMAKKESERSKVDTNETQKPTEAKSSNSKTDIPIDRLLNDLLSDDYRP